MMDRPTDLAAKIRSSVVSVVSPTGRGSGYCALSNGLIVTSLDVVGYEREVQIMHDDGAPIRALVVRANVALDVALLVPVEPVSLSPRSRPAPRPGSETSCWSSAAPARSRSWCSLTSSAPAGCAKASLTSSST
ncbi:MAG: hypothetical protein IPG04_08670 [Polyangiaceae bacterium]|nr:hypothetical protein [Polyangiaceae bacterium]